MGATILVCLTLAVFRAQHKLDLIFKIIIEDPKHPFTVIDKLASGPSRRRLIGYYVPALCSITLISLAIGAWIPSVCWDQLCPLYTFNFPRLVALGLRAPMT